MVGAAGDPAVVWDTFDYLPVAVQARGGGRKPVMLPAIRVRARPHGRMPWGTGVAKVHTVGMIDSGASATTIPAWMLDRLGIAADEGSRVPAYSASGHLSAHVARIGMDIRHNGRWHDLGVVDVLAPDTAESRNPDSGLPILLGRDGFFDRLGVCLDHAGKTFQIGRAGGWA